MLIHILRICIELLYTSRFKIDTILSFAILILNLLFFIQLSIQFRIVFISLLLL